MNILLICNLSDKSVNSGGAAWVPPPATFDEAWTISLRLVETVAGNQIASPMNVTGMAAALGPVDARPTGGTTCLQIGSGVQTSDNTTDAFYGATVTATQLQGLINAKSVVVGIYGTATVRQVDGSFLIKFSNGTAVPLQLRNNDLHPLSFGRVTATEFDGVWIQELRLIQLPLDFTDTSERVLTPAPTVTRLVAGGTFDGFKQNEVQLLYVRPDFAANYTLKMTAGGQTQLLSVADNMASIQAALEAVYGAGNFVVTNPGPWQAAIEFAGAFTATPEDLLTVTAVNPPLGDLTFTLALNKFTLLARLRAQPTIQVPFEVRLYYTDADSVAQKAVVIQTVITIGRPLIMPELADVPDQNWLRPASPKDYIPFSTSSFVVGHAFYRAVVGDASATSFVIAHGLGTDDVFVWVRENSSTGHQLTQGTNYSVQLDDANSVTVTVIGSAPALNAWAVSVVSSQTVEAFADGLTVTIGQVTGLEARLETIEANVAGLLALAPTTPLGITSGQSSSLAIVIPRLQMILLGDGTADAPPSPAGALLPAIHDASVTSFTTLPLPTVSAAAGNVYQNNSGAVVTLPGGLQVRSARVAIGGFFGGDGRVRYALTQTWGSVRNYTGTGHNGAGSITVAGLLAGDRILSVTDTTATADVTSGFTSPIASANTLAQTSVSDLSTHALAIVVQGARTSFFPSAMEVELFNFEVSPEMLRAGSTLSVSMTLLLQLLNGTSRAQYMFVLEHGTTPSQSAPATTSENLQDVVWNPTPLITQRVVMSAAQKPNIFGVNIIRAANGSLSANKVVYGFTSGADSVPVSADLALRARLINFDTENSIPTAKGTVSIDTGTITANIQY